MDTENHKKEIDSILKCEDRETVYISLGTLLQKHEALSTQLSVFNELKKVSAPTEDRIKWYERARMAQTYLSQDIRQVKKHLYNITPQEDRNKIYKPKRAATNDMSPEIYHLCRLAFLYQSACTSEGMTKQDQQKPKSLLIQHISKMRKKGFSFEEAGGKP